MRRNEEKMDRKRSGYYFIEKERRHMLSIYRVKRGYNTCTHTNHDRKQKNQITNI